MKLYELLTAMNDACPLMLDCTRTDGRVECADVGTVMALRMPEATKLMQMEIFDTGVCRNNRTEDVMAYVTLLGDISFFVDALCNEPANSTTVIFDMF